MSTKGIKLVSSFVILWLMTGGVLGWSAAQFSNHLQADKAVENPMVRRLVKELQLSREQQKKLAIAIEGRDWKIEKVKNRESSLTRNAREEIARIRADVDFIIQYNILSPSQLRHYVQLMQKENKRGLVKAGLNPSGQEK